VAQYDFFLSRRGSVGEIAREVADVLTECGYKVLVQDYDFQLGDSVIEGMHDGVKNSRDLIILFTRDYEQSSYCRKEFSSFEAQRLGSTDERHVIILRCDDVPLQGLLADIVYQDLVGVEDHEERKRRIIDAAERRSQATPPPPRPFLGVPPRIPSFTGREDQLSQLDATLIHNKPAVVTQAVGRVAVQGMGGVGKTTLAIEYAYRYRNLYAGVCWCPAETRAGLMTALASLGAALGGVRSEETDAEKAAKAALHHLAGQRATWLLVYDNVTSPSEIADLLPSAGARVLITSRFSDWSGLADEVALNILSPQEAVAFLQGRAGREDEAGARKLAEALGCLPLALDHAAAYAKRTQIPFAEYATKASSLTANAPRDAMYPQSVAATFDLAIGEAEARCSAAEEVMAFLGYCASARVPIYVLKCLTGGEQAIGVLAELSLLRHDPFEDGVPAITVHRLVQAVARQRSEAKGAVKATIQRVSEALKTPSPPSPRTHGLRVFRELTPRLRLFVHERQLWRYQLQHMIGDYEHLADRYDQAANRFDAAGNPSKAKELRDKSARFREGVSRLRKIRL
jgi:hypothetical protein